MDKETHARRAGDTAGTIQRCSRRQQVVPGPKPSFCRRSSQPMPG